MNKTLNIKNVVALIVVFFVWGYIMKTKFGFFDSEDELTSNVEYSMTPTIRLYKKDTFKLLLSPKDPFLGGKSFEERSNSTPNTNRPSILQLKNKVLPLKIEKKWPSISYFGYVKNRAKGKQACLVQINGIISKMFLESKVNDVCLKKIFKDSITVSFNGKIKTVLKNIK